MEVVLCFTAFPINLIKAVMQDAKKFEYLDALVGGWFHQDFDINGSTLEEVIAAFRNESTPEQRRHVQEDIDSFLALHEDNDRLTQDFMQTLKPDLIEQPFGMAIQQLLLKISDLLG